MKKKTICTDAQESNNKIFDLIKQAKFDSAYETAKEIMQGHPDCLSWGGLLKLYSLNREECQDILKYLNDSIGKLAVVSLKQFVPRLLSDIRSNIAVQSYREAEDFIGLGVRISERLKDGRLADRLKGYLDYLYGVELIRLHNLEKAQLFLMSANKNFLKAGIETECKVSSILLSSVEGLNIILSLPNYGSLAEIRDVLRTYLAEFKRRHGEPPYFFDIDGESGCFIPENELQDFIWIYAGILADAVELKEGALECPVITDGWRSGLEMQRLDVWIPYLNLLDEFFSALLKSVTENGHYKLSSIPLGEQKRLLKYLKPRAELVAEAANTSDVKIDKEAAARIYKALEKIERAESVVQNKDSKPKDKEGRYDVWLFRERKTNIPYSRIKKQYLDKVKQYDLFINESSGQVFLGRIYGEKALTIKTKKGREISLIGGYQFKVLVRFLKRDGNAGTVEQIFDALWPEDSNKIDKFENRVEQAIKELRKKLKKITGIECPNKRYEFSKQIKYCLIDEKENVSNNES